jgi:hypothetical protein
MAAVTSCGRRYPGACQHADGYEGRRLWIRALRVTSSAKSHVGFLRSAPKSLRPTDHQACSTVREVTRRFCTGHIARSTKMTRRKRSILYLTNKGLQLDLSAHALSKLLARYEIFKRVLDLPGDFVDCGVYRGASLFTWANLIEIFAPHSQKVVIGFDTFSGFAEDLHLDEDKEHAVRLMEDHERFVPRSCDELTTIAKSLSLVHHLRLVPGDAVNTIPEFVANNRGLRLSLLHLDFDVYEPTKAALEHLYPLLVPGGVVVLDEYGNSGWGESDAVDAFFRRTRHKSSTIRLVAWSGGIFCKTHHRLVTRWPIVEPCSRLRGPARRRRLSMSRAARPLLT